VNSARRSIHLSFVISLRNTEDLPAIEGVDL
jgi:hypothetical protein